MFHKTLYDILKIDKDASIEEIKKAYRFLALRYHPDRNTDESSQKMFVEVTNAYDVLSDHEKKLEYDMHIGHGDDCEIVYNRFDKSLYDILKISKYSSNEEIKKAYRFLALRYHPDRNTDESSQKMFVEVTNAYDVLSDHEKKWEYDMHIGHGDGCEIVYTRFDKYMHDHLDETPVTYTNEELLIIFFFFFIIIIVIII